MNQPSNKYSDLEKVLKYLRKFVQQLSTQGVYIVLLLFYAFSNKATPGWAKNIIIGAFAYFLSPLDSIPDLTPFLGMTDDLGVLTFGLVTIACYVDDDVRVKSLEKLKQLIGEDIDPSIVKDVDGWL